MAFINGNRNRKSAIMYLHHFGNKYSIHSPVLHVLLNLGVTELSTNQPLEGKDGVGRVDDGLTFSRKTDKTFSVLCEGNDGRCRTSTF